VPTVEVRGIRLYFETDGHGPWLVLLNGIFQKTTHWTPLLGFLEGYRVLRYDMRGQGNSLAPPGIYTPEVHAADLRALLEALGIETYSVLGLSNGGVVAQVFASGRPSGLQRLILAATLSRLDPLVRAKVESWRAALTVGGTELRLKVALPWLYGRRFLAQNPGLLSEEALAEARAMAPTEAAQERLLDGFLTLGDLTPALAKVEVPTLVLSGEADLLFPPSYGRETASAIRGARFLVLEGLGHLAPLEDPQRFFGAVREFLEADHA